MRWAPLIASGIVVEDALGGIVEIVELAVAYGPQEGQGEEQAETDGEGHKEEERVHHDPCVRAARSTPCAERITAALDSGIRIAATRGLIHPEAAKATATML